jgi:D-serine deaminase-like pyridoxal phosphate-dependent protein
VRIAPHGKTTMSPELIRRQLEAGAWGMTAATAWQARSMVDFGARRVIIANECIDPVGLRAVAALLASRPDVEIMCFVDSVETVQQMAAVLSELPAARPIPVLVEMGFEGGRCGARGVAEALDVGQAVAVTESLILTGVGGFEGAIGHARDDDTIAAVEAFLRDIRDVAQRLAAAGRFSPDRDVVVSAGGSAYFDAVQQVLGADRQSYGTPVEIVLRSGCYLVHDNVRYAYSSPPGVGLEAALEVWSRVLSVPEPGLAILDAGRRDVSYDADLPVIIGVVRDGAVVEPPGDLVVRQLNDQHAFVSGTGLAVGDVVVLGISHPCTTFDKWRAIPVVDDAYKVLSVAHTAF